MYRLKYFEEVEADLDALDDAVYDEVVGYFERYKMNPFACSQPLSDQGGLNLRGYRKTYVANAAYRIILRVENGMAAIVSIVAVGQRDQKKVYFEAYERIKQQP
ncbi:MAG: hypothetical protein JXK05_01755 [Campylobacterales bacterium]|nr:hypothetical protein [Campylobacterales bacterium]